MQTPLNNYEKLLMINSKSNTNHTKQNLFLGIMWKILSCFCFAAVNAIVRYLSGGSSLLENNPLPIYVIMFYENLFGTLIILPFVLKKEQAIVKSIFTTKHPILHLIRLTMAIVGIGCMYLGLRYMPIMQVIALSFAAPFITILGAIIFLHEPLNMQRTLIILLSLIGGFFITRPDLQIQGLSSFNIGWPALFPIIATILFSGDKIVTRKLLLYGEHPAAITLLLIAFSAPFCLFPAAIYGWHQPTMGQWPLLILLSIAGVGAYYTFSKAFLYAEVTILIPFSVTKMLFNGFIGYLIFAELPKTFDMWLGIIIATLSAIIISYDKPKSLTVQE